MTEKLLHLPAKLIMCDFFPRIHPQDVATDFLEFVGRNRGADHLKVASGHLSLLQYYSVDVLVFLTSVIVAVVYTIFTIFHSLLRHTRVKPKKD